MKKIISSFLKFGVLASFIIIGFLVTTDRVNAIFINTPYALDISGTVLSISGNNISLSTSGSSTMNVGINNRTVILKSPINPGDTVSVIATWDRTTYMAKLINKISNGGYGVPPPTPSATPILRLNKNVVVSRATVLSKTADTLTVRSGNIDMVFQITGNTRFITKSLSQIVPGNSVTVMGVDSGSQFTANYVVSL